ncbi:MAG: dTMP kinase [Rhodobacteraceae bacterium]|nr:dTMP kinase [Paracoccaceae bacterium]MBL6790313.1 dTMP kinase [Paracoccaceae bacterium]MBL6860789.1 dTMP kinase [Paracoccaceae bacterium]
MNYPGCFITFEGIDGSGKSTQTKLLAARLQDEGFDIILTREPGGSEGAEEIRDLVLQGATDRWSAETEILLFTAARRDHIERTILPALAQGKIVICDRFADSTRMYQGISRGNLRALVDQLHHLMIPYDPDITILIDMDPEIGLKRAKARTTSEERFEDFGLDLQKRMRSGFLELAREFDTRIAVVDGNRDIPELAETIYERVKLAFS